MIALSIRQPWAWCILHGGKDVENRTWSTRRRGRILIHAAKGMTPQEFRYGDGAMFVCATQDQHNSYPSFPTFELGGIVGSVEIVDCVSDANSLWFQGPFGFLLRDPRPMPFIPFKGRLGFFDVPDVLLPPEAAPHLPY